MKRYKTTKQKLDKSGFIVYSTTYYPDIPLSDNDTFINPIDGDRLDTLAYKYYGDVSLWWVIAKANDINGKIALSADEVIRIPGNITIILEQFRRINKTG